MYKKLALLLASVVMMVTLAACGGSNDKGSAGNASAPAQEASQEIVIKATTWEFDQPEYVIPKDTPVKITLENLKGAHGIEVAGTDIDIRGNGSQVVTLKEGTYEMRCSLVCGAGHTQMVAKVTVK
jgi:cytochrome c oxidase subunit II